MIDYFLNGQGSGNLAATLVRHKFDLGAMRPWLGKDGRSYITVNSGRYDKDNKPILVNTYSPNPALLTKEQWVEVDRTVLQVRKERLTIWNDLVAAGNTYRLRNPMGTPILQHQTVSDVTEATISMSPLRRGDRDRPQYELEGLPIPIIHKDGGFDAREIAVSQNPGGPPLDTTTIALATRRCLELVEKQLLGVLDTFTYGGYSVYGYTNFPKRVTRSITLPTAGGWTPDDTLDDVLAMIQDSIDNFFYGPWSLYFSTPWVKYLDGNFAATYNGETLRTRLAKIANITSIQTADYLTGYQIILLQKSADVARPVVGMYPTVTQWTESGGFEQKYKVWCILVPQLRADQNDNTGIVHGS